MDDYALVLNAGSSSLKFSVFRHAEGERWPLESRGQIGGIGTAPQISAKDANGRILIEKNLGQEVLNGVDALDALAAWTRSQYSGARVLGVGHRVVHGGARFHGPTVVTPEVMAELRRLAPLAPLHQVYNLTAIEAVAERLPGVPQVACFDTSFHRGQSAVAELIPLPREIRSRGVQRYGFHGLSYEYIASVLPKVAPELAPGARYRRSSGKRRQPVCFEGRKEHRQQSRLHSTRRPVYGHAARSTDPGVVLYLFQTLGLSAREVETVLYRQSGLLGISGVSSDMRDLLQSSESGARLAVDYFVYRASREIGALAAVLGGIDGLVFTAGIGENSPEIRERICASCAWLGVEPDVEANLTGGPRISARTSRVSAWVIPTNEELVIARHTGLLLGLIPAHV